MKKAFAVMMSAIMAVGMCSCAGTKGPDKQGAAAVGSEQQTQASMADENKTSSVQDKNIPSSRRNLISGDIPDNTVAVIFTPTQPRIGNAYIPEDQEGWKKAITKALEHLKDKKYDVYPHSEMKPIYFYWTHDGITDTWTLGNDGSFLGEHSTGNGDNQFKNNYIAPEDASELAKLMMQAYERLEIDPVEPGQISDIVRAELIVKDKSYVLEDADGVKKLEEALKGGKRETASGCPFELLRLYKKDGRAIDVAIATDGCAIWHSDGIYYKYGDSGKAEEIFKLFGVTLPVIVS